MRCANCERLERELLAAYESHNEMIMRIAKQARELKARNETPTSAYECQRDVSADDEIGIEYTRAKQQEENK